MNLKKNKRKYKKRLYERGAIISTLWAPLFSFYWNNNVTFIKVTHTGSKSRVNILQLYMRHRTDAGLFPLFIMLTVAAVLWKDLFLASDSSAFFSYETKQKKKLAHFRWYKNFLFFHAIKPNDIYTTVNLHCEDHSLIKMVNNALEQERENLSVTKN